MSRADELIDGVLEGKSPKEVLEGRAPRGYATGLTANELTMEDGTAVYWGEFEGGKFQYSGYVRGPGKRPGTVMVGKLELPAETLFVKLPPGMTLADLGMVPDRTPDIYRKGSKVHVRHTTEPAWKGFKRVGGRLTGAMPFAFNVMKNDKYLGRAGLMYQQSGPGRQGNVPYTSNKGRTVTMDADDINIYAMKGIISPHN